MTEWIDWLSQYAFEGGIAGLFALSVVDSVGVPTGGGPDVVVALLTSLRPDVAYAVSLVMAACVGSVVGCLALYWVGLRGGEAGARRFAANAIARTRDSLERRGAWVIFLAVLAPPPIPTKLFVFCAGIAAVPIFPFVVATFLGRLLRYGTGAALAVLYGEQALDLIRSSSTAILLILLLPGVLLLIRMGIRRWYRR
ncbi:MAG: VTT domain-containing protein [bacterium]|nr:VTT domain-containing protein [bacterium]